MKTLDFFSLRQSKATPGKEIGAFRKNFQITQSELASITGIAETNLRAMENDKLDIGLKRAA